jgi:hypothetical protein
MAPPIFASQGNQLGRILRRSRGLAMAMFGRLLAAGAFAAVFSLHHSATGQDGYVDGLFGVRIGADAWDYQLVGSQRIIDGGGEAPEWEYRINPPGGLADLDAYYVRFNPIDRSVYQVIGESRRLGFDECAPSLSRTYASFRNTFPEHPFDFDGVSTFVIAAFYPGESEIIGECYSDERVLRVYAFDALRFRSQQAQNRGKVR